MVKRIVIAIIIVILIALYVIYDVGSYLTVANLKAHQIEFIRFYNKNLLYTLSVYFGLYIIVTALSLPGVAIMTLAGGAIFGVWMGTLLVSVASALGATLSFLVSRVFLKNYLQKKHANKLAIISDGLRKDDLFYLFTLRLIPVFPFYLINLLMGQTPIKTAQFFLMSILGMLPGTLVYVNAGSQIANIKTFLGIFSPGVLVSLILLGMFPFVARKIVEHLKTRKYLHQYFKPRKFDYNLVIIGGGPAGLVSANIASTMNAKVALIEKSNMGGGSLNTASVPSKALIRSAKLLYEIGHPRNLGIRRAKADFGIDSIMERVQNTIKKLEPRDMTGHLTESGVECIKGAARIITPYEVRVNGRSLITQNIIIATGAKPKLPEINGLEMIDYFTSETIWNLNVLPAKLLILGGGPTGCEFAQSFRRLGSHVTIVEQNNRILNNEDEDVVAYISQKFKDEGIHVLLGCEAVRVVVDAQRKLFVCKHANKNIAIEFDEILVATGQVANTDGFGAQDLNLHTTVNGEIEVDEFLRTNFPNIFACGDVAGPYKYTHMASYQAWHAVVNALFQPFKKYKIDYSVVPRATFTDPELACVGINEIEAKEMKIKYDVSNFRLEELDKAEINCQTKGMVKVLTMPGRDIILGVSIVSSHASEMISEFVTAMTHGIGLHQIFKTIHIYPTFSEANQYVAANWKNLRSQGVVLKFLRWFHRWRRLRGTQQAKLH